MERYIPTLSFATAAVTIFHQPKGLPSCAAASIAQISTALGLFVIGQAARYASEIERRNFPLQPMHNFDDENSSEQYLARNQTSSFGASQTFKHDQIPEEESGFIAFFEDIKNHPMRFIRSIPASDVKWTVVTAGVLAGIGFFYDKDIRWNCMKSAAVISLAQFALAKLEPKPIHF